MLSPNPAAPWVGQWVDSLANLMDGNALKYRPRGNPNRKAHPLEIRAFSTLWCNTLGLPMESLMFYYYGRKKQIAKHYPAPNFGTIVEPFAGSAAYSLYGDNWKKNVFLVERDERICEIWQWLIHEATPLKIQNLPDVTIGEKSSEFLHIIHAATKMAFHYKTIKVTPVLARNWAISKRYMAENLFKIKHWTIICGDYTLAPEMEATWFIDPPYKENAGQGYRYGSKLINYDQLAKWSITRPGEIIFCEGNCGDYLPFQPLLNLKGIAGKTSQEFIYYQSQKAGRQLEIFPVLAK